MSESPGEPTPSEVQLRVRELLGQATLLRARGRREEALKLVEEAMALEPESWESHELAGDILLEFERGAEATERYRRALELNPERGVLEEKIGRAAIVRMARERSAELSQALLENKRAGGSVARKPAYAALFSLLVPGLGQVYNGQVLKGAVIVVCYLVLAALAAVAIRAEMAARPPSSMGVLYGPQLDPMSLLSGLFTGISALWIVLLVGLWIYSVADAAVRASRSMTSDDTGLV